MRDDAGINVAGKKQKEAKLSTVKAADLYDVERKLSLALQPEQSLPSMHRLVTKARDDLQRILRELGYEGEF